MHVSFVGVASVQTVLDSFLVQTKFGVFDVMILYSVCVKRVYIFRLSAFVLMQVEVKYNVTDA